MPPLKPNFNKAQNGLFPAIVQDASTLQVLMLGYVNAESFEMSLDTKKVTFYSRSRQEIWIKGETSGNYFDLVEYKLDCDQDAILFLVNPRGPACHLGTTSCFVEV
jgi:phosphoribosyl-AMP cyclohydrolase / phosphoribosyl-ATP pyrophosphohydrolase